MEYLLIVLLLAVALGALILYLIRRSQQASFYLSQKKPILTPPEQAFYSELVYATSYAVIYQVPLVKILNNTNTYFNLVKWNIVDFVLVDSTSYPIAIIELDDASHLKTDRQRADYLIGEALKQENIPLIRQRVKKKFDRAEIKKALG